MEIDGVEQSRHEGGVAGRPWLPIVGLFLLRALLGAEAQGSLGPKRISDAQE